MRDAIGGSVIITWILIFIVAIMSILAFSFNYTKSYRIKNAILDIIEENQGLSNKAKEEIEQKIRSYGYSVPNRGFNIAGFNCNKGVCLKFNEVTESRLRTKYCGANTNCKIGTYTVVTFIYVNVPLMGDLLANVQTNGRLRISGQTPTIRILSSINHGGEDVW